MIIKEAYNSPIVLTEAGIFEMLKLKQKNIKKSCEDILNGKIKIKDDEEIEDFVYENKDKIKDIYNAANKDINKIRTPKDIVKVLGSAGVSFAGFLGSILAPSAILVGSTLLPVQIILFITGLFSLLYLMVKSIKEDTDIETLINAKNAMYKIKRQLKNIDIDRIKNEKIKKECNKLIDELDKSIYNIDNKLDLD